MKDNLELGDIIEMKKPHACGTKNWEITRLGVDLKLKCTGCGHEIMMDRLEFNKKMKKKVNKPNA
ncbi:MAG TPA: DUF951 domain-containing protein [Firmicutes bacterium]|nr:DUF951 domain-containing protein [Bacillota bacterium]